MSTFDDPAYYSKLTAAAYNVLDRAAAHMDDPGKRRDIDDTLRAQAHATLAGIAQSEGDVRLQVQDALAGLGIDVSRHQDLVTDATEAVLSGAFTRAD